MNVEALKRKPVVEVKKSRPDLGVVRGFEKRRTMTVKTVAEPAMSLDGDPAAKRGLLKMDTLFVSSLTGDKSKVENGYSQNDSGSCIEDCCIGPSEGPKCGSKPPNC